ncbi:MAG: metalloregulator ArsR/SmtB family transcription factor [Chloroflexi bacterium]|nr:metalloregulator ArsR/SmtB family transcription factor [Chloroflexota bacterium]
MLPLAPVSVGHPSSLAVEAKFFRGLGDPTRIHILNLLLDQGELPVSRLVAALGEPQSRILTHLSCLKSCGYVVARRDGRFVYYRVGDERVAHLLTLAREILRERTEMLASCPIIDGFRPADRLRPVPMLSEAQPLDEGASCDCDACAAEATGGAEETVSFSVWLHRQLAQRKLSLHAVAEALGVSITAVRRWLYRGGYPAPELRPRLAEVLAVPVEEIRQRVRTFPPSSISAFASWLDSQLQARDWTRADLARRLGLEGHAITAWFSRGARPRRATLARLAEVLGVPPQEIPGT